MSKKYPAPLNPNQKQLLGFSGAPLSGCWHGHRLDSLSWRWT